MAAADSTDRATSVRMAIATAWDVAERIHRRGAEDFDLHARRSPGGGLLMGSPDPDELVQTDTVVNVGDHR